MFRSRVADYYRARGYAVRQGVKVRGASENIYALDLVAEGPLGALLVSFGDAAGVDAEEVARVRTVARDVGATPVLATPTATADLRRLAAQLTVVLLEATHLDEPAPPVSGPSLDDPLSKDLAAHPWPESGRASPPPIPPGLREVEQIVVAAPAPPAWQAPAPPLSRAPTAMGSFAWLDSPDAPSAESRPPLPPPKPLEHEATVQTRDLTGLERLQRIHVGRLAAYVAGGMFVLYLFVKMLS